MRPSRSTWAVALALAAQVLVAGGVGAGVGAGVGVAVARAEAPAGPLGSDSAAELDTLLREQAAGLKARATTLSDLPRLQAAVATDAATVRDLTQEELAFRTKPGEMIEIGQVPKAGAGAANSLWHSGDGGSALTELLARPGVHVAIEAGALWLAAVAEVKPKARAEELTGAIAVAAAMDLRTLEAKLRAAGAAARIEVRGKTLEIGGPGPEGAVGEERVVALDSEAGRELRLTIRAPRTAAPGVIATGPSAAVLAGAGAALLAILALLGVVAARRRSPPLSPSASANTSTAWARADAAAPAAAPMATGGSGGPTVHGTSPSVVPPPVRGSTIEAPTVALARTAFGSGDLAPVDAAAPGATGVAPTMDRVVGRYVLVKELGSGGMADVFLARSMGEAGFEKQVALKVMQRHLLRDAGLVQHFLDEARVASHLSHPNIVQIIDLGRAGDDYFIAMEFVDGADLSRLLEGARAANRQVPLPVALTLVRRICDGLHAAHIATTAEGEPLQIVHRDVKAANVFVSRNGVVKIGDFGIAKASESARSYRTRAGEVKGTMAYMAPEHRVGETVDVRADLYSAGAIAYEVLTGRLIDLDFMRLAHLGIEGWPHLSLPSEVRPELPRELDAIVFKALAYLRDHRYPDCAALEAALEEVATAHHLTATDKQVAQWVESELGVPPPGNLGRGSRVGSTPA